MSTQRSGDLSRFLGKVNETLTGDRDLLDRFVRDQDQVAFAQLVKRYGGLVQRVCRRLHLDEHVADDVFQATFLVVAQKASHLHGDRGLGAFVHTTAHQIALNALRLDCRRRNYEKAAAKEGRSEDGVDAEASASLRETERIIEGELAALADTYRVPLILHFLEGKTHEETARELHMERRTLSRRIERGLAILRQRLAKYGVGAPAIMLALALNKVEAAIPATLARTTAKFAVLYVQGSAPADTASILAAHVLSRVSGIARPSSSARVLATVKFWLSKSVVLAAVLLVAFAAVRGIDWKKKRNPLSSPSANASFSMEPLPLEEVVEGPIDVHGQVLDEAGRPVPNASVALLSNRMDRGELGRHDEVLRQGMADAQGRFTFTLPSDFPFWVPERGQAKLLASGSGRASSVAVITLAPGMAATEIRLMPPKTVRGQVLDNDNRPVAGAAVHVVNFGAIGRESVQGHLEPQSKPLSGWPQAVITNDEGRFELTGINLKQNLRLEVCDDRFARHVALLKATPSEVDSNFTIKLDQPRWLEGQVLAADTKKPLRHARLSVVPCDPFGNLQDHSQSVDARANSKGRFRINLPPCSNFKLYACAPDEDPYLAVEQTITWTEGTERQELALPLPRGVPIHGCVVEAGTGLPVSGAQVRYTAFSLNTNAFKNDKGPRPSGMGEAWTDRDGRFFVPVLPGQGQLQVYFHRGTYLMQVADEAGLIPFVPAAATMPLNLPPNCTGEDVRIVLHRAGRLQGKVVDHNNNAPVASGFVLTAGRFAHYLGKDARRFPFRGGEFAIPNADATCTYPIVILDAVREHGTVTTLSGQVDPSRSALKLERCGSAQTRLVDADDEPIKLTAVLSYTLPGKPAVEVETDWYQVLGHTEPIRTNSTGLVNLPALVPGVRYRLYAINSGKLVREFQVGPGQELSLGDLLADP